MVHGALDELHLVQDLCGNFARGHGYIFIKCIEDIAYFTHFCFYLSNSNKLAIFLVLSFYL